jgi:hypothetical protein
MPAIAAMRPSIIGPAVSSASLSTVQNVPCDPRRSRAMYFPSSHDSFSPQFRFRRRAGLLDAFFDTHLCGCSVLVRRRRNRAVIRGNSSVISACYFVRAAHTTCRSHCTI